jgi:asparagine N-glycosylation enzyme membrane subunit Stt3
MQLRFSNSFSVAWSLLLAWSLVEITSRARARFPERGGNQWIALLIGIIVLLFVVLPSVMSYRAYALNIVGALRGEPPRRNYVERLQVIRERMSDWIRNNTAPTDGWLDERAVPEYGILAPWSAGHVLKYVSRRPVVQDNFGDDAGLEGFEAAHRYFRANSEEGALAAMEGMRVRYVVVRASENQNRRDRFPRAMQTRLEKYRGSERWMVAKDTHQDPMHFSALEHHRLIFESPALWPSSGQEEPLYQIFEIVTGARVEGVANKGDTVVARLKVQTRNGNAFEYVNRVRADAEGRWQMRLPYSNEPFSNAVDTAPLYELESGDARATFRVSETEVISGRRVRAPDLH